MVNYDPFIFLIIQRSQPGYTLPLLYSVEGVHLLHSTLAFHQQKTFFFLKIGAGKMWEMTLPQPHFDQAWHNNPSEAQNSEGSIASNPHWSQNLLFQLWFSGVLKVQEVNCKYPRLWVTMLFLFLLFKRIQFLLVLVNTVYRTSYRTSC